MNFSPTQPFSPNEFFPAPAELPNGAKIRARRPCDPCRRRKSRCEVVGGSPPCLLCRFHRQDCTFNDDPQPRKRRAVTLDGDSAPAKQFQAPHAAETIKSTGLSPRDGLKIRQDLPIDDYANLRGPSLLKKTLGLQSHRHSRFIGSTSEYEQLLLELDHSGGNQETVLGLMALRKVASDDTTFALSPDAGTQNHQNDIPDLDAIETIVAPHGQALIHLYFRIVHPSFPVLHKKVFLEKYERTHREFSPPLLAAVYLLALNWWSYSTELALLPEPDVSHLEMLALKSLSNIIHRPKLSTIQAGLLLLQRPEGDSWALTSQLVALGQDLGLHLDCTTWRIPSWERGLRKRLAWAIFMQDKWGALVHGRPSHITVTDWDAQPLQNDDFPENAADEDDEDGSTEVEKGRTLFCEMIKLTQILALILSSFYTLKAEREFAHRAPEGVRWILETAKPLQLALRQWYSSLPIALKMEDLGARKLSSTGYLHLGYYAVEITLHRRIIRSLSSVDDPTLRSICRQAAETRLRSAMDFVQHLRPEHLQSFWYSASKYNFALVGTFISLLWVTSTDREEAQTYRSRFDEYRWMLRLSSKSADFLERTLTMLATSTGELVKGIPEKPDPEWVLNRYQRRARYGRSASSSAVSVVGLNRSDESAEVVPPGVAYQSESELHEDTSPENVVGRTPSESEMVVGNEWNVDYAWFNNALGEVDGFADDSQLGLDFQQQQR
ncbi:Fungal specific transcription factor [Neocucurbitaria cava]|uniref:Fungal specific transcription factor n=1 Tax=Neocucurbitaria cava TaxID=798079 RepID=A0A9W8YJ14_9PLEO|nr:Fungal specific transcription factor [Neocucurbitaria cava]